jgi:hypothetical protein
VQVKNLGQKLSPADRQKNHNQLAAITQNKRYHVFWAIFFPLCQVFYTTMVLLKLHQFNATGKANDTISLAAR